MRLLLLLATTALASDDAPKEPAVTDDDRGHWAFRPPARVKPPAGGHPIDAFVRAKLREKGIAPAPAADKLTLLRRVSFDLTGLMPTPAEAEAFLKDASPGAYEAAVDRLLASPHYGERRAQHWLDGVRFAETNGYEADGERSQAWRYRDYVIRAFAADKPYDVFLTEQLAGDELAAGKDPKAAADLWIATGMQRCGPAHLVGGNVVAEVIRQENLTEMVNGVGAAVLGLTVGCARCHDHKFDPVSQADYFRMQAFFAGTHFRDVNLATKAEKAAFDATAEDIARRTGPLRNRAAAIEVPYRKTLVEAKRAATAAPTRAALAVPPEKRTPAEQKLVKDAQPFLRVSWDEVLDALSPADRATRAAIQDQIHAIEDELPPPPAKAWAAVHEAPAPPTHVLKRGEYDRKGAVVAPGFPRVLVSADAPPKTRLELARWLAKPDHPLTARVMVNRIWQQHFGVGLVATPNDFGIKGELPTHPELLDFLANELAAPAAGTPWAMKRIHKLIATSETYKQSSRAPAHAADPDNKLLGRQNRKRMDAEAIRDAVLVAAGTLARDVGGRGVKGPLEPEVYDLIFTEEEPSGLWRVTTDARQHDRRSIYLFNKRNVRLPLLEAFDQPDTLTPCAARQTSTFAPQALILMNGPFTHSQSRILAGTLAANPDPAGRVDELYRRAFGRPATAREHAAAAEFLAVQAESVRVLLAARKPVILPPNLPAGADPAAAAALADVCLAVFNTNDFVYVP